MESNNNPMFLLDYFYRLFGTFPAQISTWLLINKTYPQTPLHKARQNFLTGLFLWVNLPHLPFGSFLDNLYRVR